MDRRLEGRTAVVTGAARGIGLAIAQRLAREGARTILADIDAFGAENEAGALRKEGCDATATHVDIGDDASVAQLTTTVSELLGKVHILVNNAAILDMTAFHGMSMQRYLSVIDVNQHGAVRVTLGLHDLMTDGWGRIVNIASIMGVRGARDSIPYSTAKGAVVNFTRALAADLASHGINVNAICPGFINTSMAVQEDGTHEHDSDWFKEIYLRYRRIMLGRAGSPEDVAGPAFFLCSDDSRYVTGQILLVDGGVSATF